MVSGKRRAGHLEKGWWVPMDIGLRTGILLSYLHIDMELAIRLLRGLCRMKVLVVNEYLKGGMIVDKEWI
jgi:hypothetical protein